MRKPCLFQYARSSTRLRRLQAFRNGPLFAKWPDISDRCPVHHQPLGVVMRIRNALVALVVIASPATLAAQKLTPYDVFVFRDFNYTYSEAVSYTHLTLPTIYSV